ncbi:PREDICTED: uncharacterized protein LOC104793881 [Camelina sativa]|uniref:Uncharacterized protein LOC104793881 n=1 Tax=Camelina sativa TaxID=90675 RepID=A0ABM0ZPC0_CAMSA|nr:PREDICTED: uncharacterized protein LOC104793881 [Camelina sativa]
MTRPPTTSGRLFGTSRNLQSGGSQSAGLRRPSSPRPSNSNAAAIIEPNEEREQIAPVIRDTRVLHPSRRNGAKWFKSNTEVSTRIRKIIESCFNGPWYSWSKVPGFFKDSWFTTFKTYFEWDASIEHLVKANFDQVAATRLKGMVSLAKSNAAKPNGEKPDWILSEHWSVMSDYWRTPKAKGKSEKARTTRLSTRDGLGVHRHRAGSRSYVKVQDALVANNEDSSFIAIAGISKQGRVFGIGSLHNGISMSLGDPSVPQPTEEEVGTLTHRLEELENELKKSRDGNLLLEKRLQALEDNYVSTSSPEISM